jgi:hypothetical protein
MKVRLRLKNWKRDNTKEAWDTIIHLVVPRYRTGVSHDNLSIAFQNDGFYDIDFGTSTVVANNFMRELIVAGANKFDIGTVS